MSTADPNAEAAGTTQTPNLVKRVVMVFTAPTRLGEALQNRSPWFWTLVPVAVIGLIVALSIPTELIVQAAQQTMAQRQGGTPPPPETIARMGRIFGALGAAVGPIIGCVVVAALLYFLFNVLFGQDEKYSQHLSAAAHVFWIVTLGSVVTLPLMIAKGDMNTQLSLGLLVQDPTANFIGRFLNGITIFGLWGTGALGLVESGLSGGRVSSGKAITAVFGLYLVWALIVAGFRSISG